MMNHISILNEYMDELQITLDDTQLAQFQRYYELLIEWNSFMNLTAITEFQDVLEKHFADSLCIIKGMETDMIRKLYSGEKVSLLDIGTGAGFPSIPLKIAFPNLQITMLDSLNKRIKFLNEVIDNLELKNIEALHGRAEDFASPSKLREKFDIVVSRAVANLSTLSEYCLPYVKADGIFAAYKSEEFSKSDEKENALAAIQILGGKLEQIYEYCIPKTDYYRCLCIIRKVKLTPKKYPRKAGLPSKEPICKI